MKYIPFHLTQIRGRMGKLFVIKKSKYGYLIKTKYPNMKHIKATIKQRERREVFKQAVLYAKWIYAEADRKKAFLKTVRRRKHHAFQSAMKLYLHASPERQLNLKLTMLRSCLSLRKLQRETKIANGNYFNQGPWKQIWPDSIDNKTSFALSAPYEPLLETIYDEQATRNNVHYISYPITDYL